MEPLFELLGLAMPDSAAWWRIKVGLGGCCGVGAGLLFLATGLDDSFLWGGSMLVCGAALFAVAGGILDRRAPDREGEPHVPPSPPESQ